MKHRFFVSLLRGGDADAERLYRWHIATRKDANAKWGIGMDGKSGTDEYVTDCRNLVVSMSYGFAPQYPIPIDPNGELLGGAHRLACALALGIATVPIAPQTRLAWAPAWDEAWFRAHGITGSDLERLRRDWESLQSR